MDKFLAFYHGSLLGEYDSQAEADDATEELRLRDLAEAQEYHTWLSQDVERPEPHQWRPRHG